MSTEKAIELLKKGIEEQKSCGVGHSILDDILAILDDQSEDKAYQLWWDKEGRKWADNSGVGKFDIGKVVWEYKQKEIDRLEASNKIFEVMVKGLHERTKELETALQKIWDSNGTPKSTDYHLIAQKALKKKTK